MYNPIIPKTETITPVEKKIDAIILAQPKTELPNIVALTILNKINIAEIRVK
jgi:hypothetical protein